MSHTFPAMDWFSWLSKTGLEPSLVYDYGLVFSHNKLEEDDTAYFNHEFLQSMGISIAKHRLEILKLSREEKGSSPQRPPVSRLIVAIKRTKSRLSKYFRSWARLENTALVLVPNHNYSSRWKGAMLRRNKRVVMVSNRGRLLLTNGSPRVDSFAGSLVHHDLREDDKMNGYDHPSWSTRVKEIRWDEMFQDLKPT